MMHRSECFNKNSIIIELIVHKICIKSEPESARDISVLSGYVALEMWRQARDLLSDSACAMYRSLFILIHYYTRSNYTFIYITHFYSLFTINYASSPRGRRGKLCNPQLC